MLAQSVLFIAIFSGLAVIWERDLGITQRLLVAPVARTAVILGKAAGAGVRAGVNVGILVVAVAVVRVPLHWSLPSVVGTLVFSVLGATLFSAVSMVIASAVRSREQFMGLGQLVTLPLLFASNALYAVTLMPGWLQGLAPGQSPHLPGRGRAPDADGRRPGPSARRRRRAARIQGRRRRPGPRTYPTRVA